MSPEMAYSPISRDSSSPANLLISRSGRSRDATDINSSQIYSQPLQLNAHIAQIVESAFGHFEAGDQDLADAMRTDQSGQVVAAEDSIAPQQHPGLPRIIINESDRLVTISRIIQQF